ncbi:EAL domain-containing protein [Geomesophilobacter sediminis]|uniref:EAL domain-containing protein n=1 Tax=Geomesophilobacter sediminis TaxID=2798584 RepID=A0A8J7JFZ1_9BACT|nr:EAL domain-containing protein [Geomesophilobacter sediminis]MBJ6723225.1 EAL domain-containing protein [Geomesophilobacter sediminis]
MSKDFEKNKKIQWTMLGITIFLVTGAVAHNLYRIYRDTVETEKYRLLAQARVIGENLNNRLMGTEHTMMAIRDELSEMPTENWKRTSFAYESKLIDEEVSGIRAVLVLDRQGKVRLSNRKELEGLDLSQRDYFRQARKNPNAATLYLSPPLKTRSGHWIMNLVRGISDERGFAGVVAAGIDPASFKPLLDSVNYAPDMQSAIVHEDGGEFVTLPGKPDHVPNIRSSDSVYARHLASGKQSDVFIYGTGQSGQTRMTAVISVKPRDLLMDKGFLIATTRSMSAITSNWREHARNQLGILLFISFSSSVALAGFQRFQQKQRQIVERTDAELRETQQQLREMIDFLPDAVLVTNNDKKVVIWNRAMEEMTGVSKEEMVGKGDYEYTVPFYGQRRKMLVDYVDDHKEVIIGKYSAVTHRGETVGVESFCPSLHGGVGAYVWAVAAPLYDSVGKRIGTIESIRDVTKQKEVQAAMVQNQEYLRKLYHGLENSASAVMITDVHGTIEYVNRKFTEVTGYAPEEALGKNPRIMKSQSTPPEVFKDLWNTILSGREWRGEVLNRRKTGEVYWSVASISPLRNEKGEITHFIANVEDINERKNAEATIEHLAYYDPLTELPNRRMLKDRLDLAMRRSRRQENSIALMYLDLDTFKHINDSLGHPAGDQLLREMSRRYRESLRDDDIVCRLGGDEFAIILHDIRNEEDVAVVASKLLEQTTNPVELEGMEVTVSVSIGIALFPRDGADAETLEKHADIALYHSKGEGKNTFRFFHEELNRITRDHMALDHALRHAVQNDELVLLYQPKVNLETGEVTGVEALLRWNSPTFGMVSPIRFIPIAESNRTIIPIGEWVLRTACRQQVAWREQGLDLDMAVNISPIQFKSQAVISQVSSAIAETGIDPARLELELTESTLVEKPEAAMKTMNNLREIGCGIAIDDFGTGYSSLSYLRNFPVTCLKIDRSFICELAKNAGDRAIARSIVELAKSFGTCTVAEGVEGMDQQDILSDLGCDYIQGYLYSPPVAAERLVQVVQEIKQGFCDLHYGGEGSQ